MATGVGLVGLAGVGLIIGGVTLLVLVDAPRRALALLGRLGGRVRPGRRVPVRGAERRGDSPVAGAYPVGLWLIPPGPSPDR